MTGPFLRRTETGPGDRLFPNGWVCRLQFFGVFFVLEGFDEGSFLLFLFAADFLGCCWANQMEKNMFGDKNVCLYNMWWHDVGNIDVRMFQVIGMKKLNNQGQVQKVKMCDKNHHNVAFRPIFSSVKYRGKNKTRFRCKTYSCQSFPTEPADGRKGLTNMQQISKTSLGFQPI